MHLSCPNHVNEHSIVKTKNSPMLIHFYMIYKYIFTIELVYVSIMSKPCKRIYI